jgi:hypothetical protein
MSSEEKDSKWVEEQDRKWNEALTFPKATENLEQKFTRAANGLKIVAKLGKALKGNDIILGNAGAIVSHENLDYRMNLSKDGSTTIMPLGYGVHPDYFAFRDYSFNARDYRVDVDGLLSRLLAVGGEDSRIQVKLELGSFPQSPRKDDVRKYLNMDPIKSERVGNITADLFTSPKPITVQFWKHLPDSVEDKRYKFRVQCAKPYELEIMKMMEGKGMSFKPDDFCLEYETEANPWTLAECLRMTEDIGSLAGTTRYLVTSLEMDIPIKNLKITHNPPQLTLEYSANGLDISYSHRDPSYGYMDPRFEIAVTVPIQDLSKAVNIFGAVKPR